MSTDAESSSVSGGIGKSFIMEVTHLLATVTFRLSWSGTDRGAFNLGGREHRFTKQQGQIN